MIEQYKDDFYLMLKHSIGYIPWVKKYPHRLDRLIYGDYDKHCRYKESNHRQLVRKIIEERVCENEMIDIFYKSIIRSEIRFSSRFIPQRSHEERLTGHLISEIGASIEIIKSHFEKTSIQEYGEKKDIDFFYFDMSKGGKLEKRTGADLAISVIIDLPDYPKMIKSFVFQAKKYSHSAQIDLQQYETLNNLYGKSKGYLFYDTSTFTLSSPFVLETDDYTMRQRCDEAIKDNNKSFSISEDDIFDGLPLSAFLCFNLLTDDNIGNKHRDLADLISYFSNFNSYYNKNIKEKEDDFSGYLGIVSIGKKLNYQPNFTNERYELILE
jgi:hypothetical protein